MALKVMRALSPVDHLTYFLFHSAGWANLRKVSIWQTVSALEQEFRDRATQLANSQASCKADDSDADVKDLDKSIDNISVNDIHDDATPAVAEEKLSDTRTTSMNTYPVFNSPEKTGYESNNNMFSDARSKIRPVSQVNHADLKEITNTARNDINMSDKTASPSTNDRVVSSSSMEPMYSLSSTDALAGQPRRPVLKGHHLPKLENQSLSKKMEDIRNSMANISETDAPWDSFGRPKGLGGAKGDK